MLHTDPFVSEDYLEFPRVFPISAQVEAQKATIKVDGVNHTIILAGAGAREDLVNIYIFPASKSYYWRKEIVSEGESCYKTLLTKLELYSWLPDAESMQLKLRDFRKMAI